jgi:uncharacterized protein
MERCIMNGCHVMAKPASSRCNLDCHYCFYIDKPRQPRMDDATLEAYIRQHIDAQPGQVVEFAWQGGEPTLAGLSFFERAVALQQRYAAGRRIQNTLQTNGILLDDAWCAFLARHGWLVGLSLDGPADLHDRYRVTRAGKPTHERVMEAMERLKAHGVDFNLLTVVNAHNVGQPERLYRYLRDLGTPHLQFIPLVESDEQGALTPESVSGEAWGRFLNAVFAIWVCEDIGRIFVQLFDSTLGVWCGHPSQMCVFSETCGHAFALEADGTLYQCDHYVFPEYRLGNLHEIPIAQINASDAARAFGQHKRRSLVNDCLECRARPLCQGDCPKHRLDGGKSVLCAGYRDFFTRTAPYMKTMRDLIRQRRSPVELMAMLHASEKRPA